MTSCLRCVKLYFADGLTSTSPLHRQHASCAITQACCGSSSSGLLSWGNPTQAMGDDLAWPLLSPIRTTTNSRRALLGCTARAWTLLSRLRAPAELSTRLHYPFPSIEGGMAAALGGPLPELVPTDTQAEMTVALTACPLPSLVALHSLPAYSLRGLLRSCEGPAHPAPRLATRRPVPHFAVGRLPRAAHPRAQDPLGRA